MSGLSSNLCNHVGHCRELAAQKGVDPALAQLTSKGDRTLAECFKLFDVIHRCPCCLSGPTHSRFSG